MLYLIRLLYPINYWDCFGYNRIWVRVYFVCIKLQSLNKLLELLNVVTNNFIGLQRLDRLIMVNSQYNISCILL